MKKTQLFSTLAMIVCLASASLNAQAQDVTGNLLDFETGTVNGGTARAENVLVSTVTTPDNVLTFSLDGTATLPKLAQAGNGTKVAFNNFDIADDTPAVGQSEWSLGKGTLPNAYIISFGSPVTDFAIDLYDYRSDGSEFDGNPGTDAVGLQAFLGGSPVSLAGAPLTEYTVPDPRPVDGNIVGFHTGSAIFDRLVIATTAGIEDKGTAIDNISFRTVPEPTSLVLGCLALAGLMKFRKRAA
ncbi:MAG: PEP-CTERM sorting domain-containing protein [Pirellulaceae bacterium]|nr:PEP-CTERM sorting domain-containing protein [Planctomycetales bacterium]